MSLDIKKNKPWASGKQEVNQKETEASLLFFASSFLQKKPVLLAFCQPEPSVHKYFQILRPVKMEVHKDALRTINLKCFCESFIQIK